MAEVKVFYDREDKTLTVWFTDRSEEHVCEETGDEVVLKSTPNNRSRRPPLNRAQTSRFIICQGTDVCKRSLGSARTT